MVIGKGPESTEPVTARQFAQRCWRLVTRRNRRTAVAVAAAITVIAILVAGSIWWTGRVPMDVAPPRADEPRLPPLDTAVPRNVPLEPGQVTPLSEAPVTRALALFQGMEPGDPVFVLGGDGRVRLLDTVGLGPPTDPEGNKQPALDATSLSPNGTRAAFAQRDEVTVVDLTTGNFTRFPLAGYNRDVLWRHDGNGLIVEQERSFLLDVETGEVRDQPYVGHPYGWFDAVATTAHTVDNDVVRIGRWGEGGLELSRWTLGGDLVSNKALPVTEILAEYGFSRGWRNDDLLALSLTRTDREIVVLADLASGELVRALRIEFNEAASGPGWVTFDRASPCCPVLGWRGPDTVLVQSMNRVLAWNVRTGELRLIAELPPKTGQIALADLSR